MASHEIPPRKEGAPISLILEAKGKGFTLSDSAQENYLWLDADGNVKWTKDKREVEQAKKDIDAQLKELYESEQKDKAHIEALEKAKTEAQEKIDTKKKEEAELIAGKTSTPEATTGEKTLDEKFKEAEERITRSVDEKVEKALGPSDEELLKQKQAELLADIRKKYQPKRDNKIGTAQRLLTDAQNEQDLQIHRARNEYINAYSDSVKNTGVVKKSLYKIGNFLGLNTKDKFTNTLTEKSNYDYEKNWKGDHTLDRFAQKRIEDRLEEYKKEGKTPEEIQALEERYKRMIAHKNEAFSNTDVDFVKRENKTLNTYKEHVWEENKRPKTELEKRAEQMLEKTNVWLDNHPRIKKTLGNKWFRFAVTTGTIGLLTGGFSPFFIANRLARFGGGMAGGRFGKYLGDTMLSQEKMDNVLSKKLAQLEQDYKQGIITASDYDTKKDKIDLLMTRYTRLKQGLVIGGAVGGGMAGGALESTLAGNHTPSTGENEVPKKAPVKPGTETPVENTPQHGDIHPKPAQPETPVEHAPVVEKPHTPNEYSVIQSGSGKGIEHAFRAQIEHDGALAQKLKEIYQYEGSIDTPEELKKFSGVIAHKMALSEGYVGTDGAERYVMGTAAYEIKLEGNEVVIQESALDQSGTWIETETSSSTFETGVDKNADGHIYEKTHTPPPPVEHISNLKASLNTLYNQQPVDLPPPSDVAQGGRVPNLRPIDLPAPTITQTPIDLPPPIARAPIDLPPPTIQPQPTVNVQPVGYNPQAPRIYNPSVMNPGPANPFGANLGNLNNIPQGPGTRSKGILDILIDGFFGGR